MRPRFAIRLAHRAPPSLSQIQETSCVLAVRPNTRYSSNRLVVERRPSKAGRQPSGSGGTLAPLTKYSLDVISESSCDDLQQGAAARAAAGLGASRSHECGPGF